MVKAYSVWQGRIAPVFDVSNSLIVRENNGSSMAGEKNLVLPPGPASRRIAFLKENRIDYLVCGALTRESAELLEQAGIKCLPFRAGEISEVIRADESGVLFGKAFFMPGCGRQGMCCRKRHPGGWRREK